VLHNRFLLNDVVFTVLVSDFKEKVYLLFLMLFSIIIIIIIVII